MSQQVSDTVKLVPGIDLGGPGAPDPALCAKTAIAALGEAAGMGMRMTSLALDVASRATGSGMIQLTIRTDKRAKSIVFTSLEARVGDAVLFTAQGLFSKVRGSL